MFFNWDEILVKVPKNRKNYQIFKLEKFWFAVVESDLFIVQKIVSPNSYQAIFHEKKLKNLYQKMTSLFFKNKKNSNLT